MFQQEEKGFNWVSLASLKMNRHFSLYSCNLYNREHFPQDRQNLVRRIRYQQKNMVIIEIIEREDREKSKKQRKSKFLKPDEAEGEQEILKTFRKFRIKWIYFPRFAQT